MAKTKKKKKTQVTSKAKGKSGSQSRVGKSAGSTGRSAKASRKPVRKAATRTATKAKAASKLKKTSARRDGREGMIAKVFDRMRPLFRNPVDPRIKHLVEVFGVEAVSTLIGIARDRINESHREELERALSAIAGRPAPLRHGSWVWHELMTTDTDASKRFYRELFGWQPQESEMMPGFNYTTFTSNGTDIAGMMAIGPEHGEMRSGWGAYVKVDDVDVAAERAESLGGEIIVPPHDIPVGRWAMIKDPAGAVLSIFRAKA